MMTTTTQPHVTRRTPSTPYWEWMFCPSLYCGEDGFLIKPLQQELWEIRTDITLQPHKVAATHPICPTCAATLISTSVKGQPDPH